MSGGARELAAVRLAEVGDDSVEARDDLVGSMAGNVLAEGGAVDLTPGTSGTLRETVHLGEQVVGH